MSGQAGGAAAEGGGPAPNGFSNGRVNNRLLFLYAIGGASGILGTTVNSLTNPIFNIELHVSLVWLGLIIAANRLLDSLTDLLVGYWSDRFVTRWGRRRPLIFVGVLLAAVMFVLLWMVPAGLSDKGVLVWYGVVTVVFYFGTTLFGTGYWALGIELATDYHERTRVAAWRAYATSGVSMLSPWFLWFIYNKDIFPDPLTGMRWLGVGIALLVLATMLPVAIFSKERYAGLEKRVKEHISFRRAVTVMFENREFVRMTAVGLLMMSSLVLFEQLALYINFFYVFGGDKAAASVVTGVAGNLGVALGLAGIPLVQWLSRRVGKHVTVRLALGWMILGSIIKWWCYTPDNPWLQLVVPFFYSIGISCFFTLMPSITADLVDVDELLTGERREAMFSAVGNLINKIANAGVTAMTGVVMALTGFVVENGGDQTPETFLRMRMLYSFAAAGVLGLALWIAWGYGLTERRILDLQAELGARREKLSEEDNSDPPRAAS